MDSKLNFPCYNLGRTFVKFHPEQACKSMVNFYICNALGLNLLESCLMPCPFTGPKMFCDCPNTLFQPKSLIAVSASSKSFVLAQKPILMNANHRFVWHKMVVTTTICKYFFGPAQNILGPVKGQKFESSAFAFVCFEISTLLKLEIRHKINY